MMRILKINYGNCSKLLFFLLFCSVKITAQQPVDLFTGDLKYNIPIMTRALLSVFIVQRSDRTTPHGLLN